MGNVPSINDKKGSTFDSDGFNGYGFHKDTHLHRDTNTTFNKKGLNYRGFRENGIHAGTDEKYDETGYDINDWSYFFRTRGYKTLHRLTGTEYGPDGYNCDGFSKDGYNSAGFDNRGYNRQRINKRGFIQFTNKHYLTGTYYDPDGYYVLYDGKVHKSQLQFSPYGYGMYDQWGLREGDGYHIENAMQDSQYR
jgi:hypothetical protein